MTRTEWELDDIVKEVLKRLRPLSQEKSGPDSEFVELTLSERVVSLAVLEGRLTRVARLLIDRRAVVTPAAHDELRQRGIEICRLDDVGERTAPDSDWCCLLSLDAPTRWVLRIAAAIAPPQEVPCHEETIRGLEEMIHEDRRIVWFSDKPALSVCLANRQPWLRAAAAENQRSVHEAVRTLDPNLLVVDPRGRSPYEVSAMIRLFQSSGKLA